MNINIENGKKQNKLRNTFMISVTVTTCKRENKICFYKKKICKYEKINLKRIIISKGLGKLFKGQSRGCNEYKKLATNFSY